MEQNENGNYNTVICPNTMVDTVTEARRQLHYQPHNTLRQVGFTLYLHHLDGRYPAPAPTGGGCV